MRLWRCAPVLHARVGVRVAGGRQPSLRDGEVAMERDAAGLRAGSITYSTSTRAGRGPPWPTCQRLRRRESGDVPDLGEEDRGEDRADATQPQQRPENPGRLSIARW